jgi:CRISPR-associated protein Cas5/CasD subtype I-E
VSAALGLQRDDTKGLKELLSLNLDTYRLKAGSIFSDFQTIGGGYSDPMFIPVCSDGKSLETKISNRDYLWDAHFIVVLSGDAKVIEKVSDALADPVYSVFLGRKSCISSQPLIGKIYDTEKEVLEFITKQHPLDVVKDTSEIEAATDALPDVPENKSQRIFGMRFVEYTPLYESKNAR